MTQKPSKWHQAQSAPGVGARLPSRRETHRNAGCDPFLHVRRLLWSWFQCRCGRKPPRSYYSIQQDSKTPLVSGLQCYWEKDRKWGRLRNSLSEDLKLFFVLPDRDDGDGRPLFFLIPYGSSRTFSEGVGARRVQIPSDEILYGGVLCMMIGKTFSGRLNSSSTCITGCDGPLLDSEPEKSSPCPTWAVPGKQGQMGNFEAPDSRHWCVYIMLVQYHTSYFNQKIDTWTWKTLVLQKHEKPPFVVEKPECLARLHYETTGAPANSPEPKDPKAPICGERRCNAMRTTGGQGRSGARYGTEHFGISRGTGNVPGGWHWHVVKEGTWQSQTFDL